MGKSKHSVEIVKTDLQIDEDLDAHRRGWAAQRIGFFFIFTMVLLAAVGVFGDGPASKHSATHSQITVESERFYRFEARMELKIHVAHAQGDALTVTFPNHYLHSFRVDAIVPEPTQNRINDGAVSYIFAGSGSMDVTFFLIPQTQGTVAGNLEVNDQTFSLKHFIYP